MTELNGNSNKSVLLSCLLLEPARMLTDKAMIFNIHDKSKWIIVSLLLAQEQTSCWKTNRRRQMQPQCDIDVIKTLSVGSIYCQCESGLFHVWCKHETFPLFLFHQSVSLMWKSHCCGGYFQFFFFNFSLCYQGIPAVCSSLCLLPGVY